ncbi:hypothetical protein GCM10027449_26910 [Sinomonas notoginsengisoli]
MSRRTASKAPSPADRMPWARMAGGAAVVAALAVLPLFAIEVPGILPGPTYTPGSLQLLALCFAMAAAALSYHLLLGAAGLLSFGHALSFGAGVYGLAVILGHLGLPLVPAALLALALACMLALAVGSISLRVGGIPFAMVTLAFAQAGSVLVRRNPGGATGGDEGLSLATGNLPDALVGVVNTRNLYWLALVVLVLVYAVVLWIQSSRAGHVAEAVRENELRVRVLGLAPFAPKLLAFTVGGALASVAGMVYLLLQSGAVPRSVSTDLTITLLVMVVLGGVGSRWGAIVGGMVYTLLDQRLAALAASPAVKELPPVLRIPLSEPLFILGTLFILVVMFMPGGLAGAAARVRARRRGGAPALEPAERLEKVLEDA